jgi:hypothetical protein
VSDNVELTHNLCVSNTFVKKLKELLTDNQKYKAIQYELVLSASLGTPCSLWPCKDYLILTHIFMENETKYCGFL